MLKEIIIKNFKSFKNEIFFSMEAADVSEHPSHIIEKNNNKILKVASIYGPNGGGKSNLLEAIRFFNLLLRVELKSSDDEDRRFISRNLLDYFDTHLDSDDNFVDGTIFFVTDKYEIGYSVKLEKDNDELIPFIKVISESVAYRQTDEVDFKNVFERKENKIIADDLLNTLSLQDSFVMSSTSLFLNYFYRFLKDNDMSNRLIYRNINVNQHRKLDLNNQNLEVLNILVDELDKIKYNSNLEIIPSRYDRIFIKNYDKENKHYPLYVKLLKIFDIGIVDFKVIYFGDDLKKLYCIHSSNGVNFELDYNLESAGTKKIIQFIPIIIQIIESNSVFLVDELDLRLHPKITEKIVEIFNSNLNKESQIIFNSHDIINMKKELFRRDEIWFTSLNEKLSSDVLSLAGMVNYKGDKVRNDANYSKQYAEGKFGSDPFISKGLALYD